MNMTLLRFGFGTMEADNFDDGDENIKLVEAFSLWKIPKQ